MSGPRWAVYWAPPADHPLWVAGVHWLGRDTADPQDGRGPRCPEVAEPWRYGWHATLKAPMRLAPGRSLASLQEALARLAQRHHRFEMPPLATAWLSDFLALRPVDAVPEGHALRRLADDAVQSLDAWRAPPTEADRARHDGPGLSERQRASLRQWGYPHVLADWRLHLTLTGPLQADRAHWLAAAQSHFAPALAEPLACADIALFMQPAPDAPFQLQQRFPLSNPEPSS